MWNTLHVDSDSDDDDGNRVKNYQDRPVIVTTMTPVDMAPPPVLPAHTPFLKTRGVLDEVLVTATWWTGVKSMLEDTPVTQAFDHVVCTNRIGSLLGTTDQKNNSFVVTFEPPRTIRLRAPQKNMMHAINAVISDTIQMLERKQCLTKESLPSMVDRFTAKDDIDSLKQMEIGLPYQCRWTSAERDVWLCQYKNTIKVVESIVPPTLLCSPEEETITVREYIPCEVLQGVITMGQLVVDHGGKTLVVTEPDRFFMWKKHMPKETEICCFLDKQKKIKADDFKRVISDTRCNLSNDQFASDCLVWMILYQGFQESVQANDIRFGDVLRRIHENATRDSFPISVSNVECEENYEYSAVIKTLSEMVKKDPYALIDILPRVSAALAGGDDMVLSTNQTGGKEEEPPSSCSVCLWEKGEPIDTEEVPFCGRVTVPGCGHQFHESCLRSVMARSVNACPFCRGSTRNVVFNTVVLSSSDHKVIQAYDVATSELAYGMANLALIIGPPGAMDRVSQAYGIVSSSTHTGELRIAMIQSNNADAANRSVIILCHLNIYNPLDREQVQLCAKEITGKDIAVHPTTIVQIRTPETHETQFDWYRALYRKLI